MKIYLKGIKFVEKYFSIFTLNKYELDLASL